MNCPKCKAKTEVLETAKAEQNTRRRRRCTACGHRFSTVESSAELQQVVTIIPQDFAEGFKRKAGRRGAPKVDVEAIAAAIRVDRRKAAIAADQRANRTRSEVYDDDDAAPSRLSRVALRREIKGY